MSAIKNNSGLKSKDKPSSEKTIKWYYNDSPSKQANNKDVEYNFIAIG